MQSLLAPPRAGRRRDDVLALIHADDLVVATGFELLDRSNDLPVADVSSSFDAAASTITWTGSDELPRKLDAKCYREFAWDADRVRVYRDLSSPLLGLAMRFYRGVFVLTNPEQYTDDRVWIPSFLPDDADQLDAAGAPTSAAARTVVAYDKLTLLRSKIGRTWQTAWKETAQSTFLGPEVRRLIAASRWTGPIVLGRTATIDPETTPILAPQTWPYDSAGGSSFLRVLVDLLAGCGFERPWTDEVGALRADPLQAAADAGPEYVLDADDARTTILAPLRQRSQNIAATPNSFRYVATSWPRPTVEGDGEVTLAANLSNGPASITARGGEVWNDDVGVDGVSTQAALVAVATARRERDLRGLAVRNVSTGPIPVMGHLDRYQLVDAAWGAPRLAIAKTYVEPLAENANVLTKLTVEELP